MGESSAFDDPEKGMTTPREDKPKGEDRLSPAKAFDKLERELSPESKFSIQMTPSKTDKIQHYEPPEKKYKQH